MNKFWVYVILSAGLVLVSYWCANTLNDSVASSATTIWFAIACLVSGVLGLFAGVSAITEIEYNVR